MYWNGSYNYSKRVRLIALSCALVVVAGTEFAHAAPAAIRGHMEAFSLDSGVLANPRDVSAVVYSKIVDLGPEVPWVRVVFSEANLPPASAVRVTSLLDGESQTLDAEALALWYNGTGFFNGSAVRVELIAGPGTRGNLIQIRDLYVGEPVPHVRRSAAGPGDDIGGVAEICGGVDNRVQVDPKIKPSVAAVGRLLSGQKKVGKNENSRSVCTAFIIDTPAGLNKLHLTAGHCFGNHNQNLTEPWILQFNVPKSNADCVMVHPTILDQWIVDGARVMSFDDGEDAIGNDYAVFACHPHQIDLATTFEAQGAAYALAPTTPETANVQVPGYGSDGGLAGNPNDCGCIAGNADAPKNFVLQSDKGPAKVVMVEGKPVIGHEADTCGGNSGSPIVDQSTGLVIGIHTNGGCKGVGQNFGTEINNAGLLAAIVHEKDKDDDLSICDVDGLNAGCWSGCDTDTCDTDCQSLPESLSLEEENNFLPIELALVQKGSKINRFQIAVNEILAKQDPQPQIVKIGDVQDAIDAIQAKPGSNVVIFGHGAPGSFKVGEDNLSDPGIQDKFTSELKGKLKSLTLFGCEVSKGDIGQDFLKKLMVALKVKIKTWDGTVYAFPNKWPDGSAVPEELANKFFLESGTIKKEIPTVTAWGMVVMTLLVLAAGTIIVMRRRAVVV